ncbi:inactive hydroxysteroid dehydrogenase-like protein 1 [Clavelina lepadiformis]|uniref:Uncharacterized protein n=1 Tax=Clavelina lepadiformis TaxID=159417 RepID=A0ABP0H0T8_CLALP
MSALISTCDSFFFLLKQISHDLNYISTNTTNVLALIGAWYTFRLSVKVGSWFVTSAKCVTSSFRRNYIKSYGQWAVVTGCTSGIGQSFARRLASEGLNIILISRNSTALKVESSYIENMYNVHTLILEQDFANVSLDSMKEIKEIFNKLDIGILINNVGIHYDFPMRFDFVDEERTHSLIQVNIRTTVSLTHAVLPGMIKRKRGLVVNMSSGAACLPIPYIALYSATKEFISHFSESLHYEMKQYNIHVQSLMPMYVATNMTSFSKILNQSSLITPTPVTYVNQAMRTLGLYRVNTGYFPHTVQTWFLKVTPRFLSIKLSHWFQLQLNQEGISKKKNI